MPRPRAPSGARTHGGDAVDQEGIMTSAPIITVIGRCRRMRCRV
jgi:hypothetical protein